MRVIGTAGHVDHGKSTLVKALTGIDPDRLKEEKERQMTIDLGFAWGRLPSGTQVGFVDVPGHRDFIENMLAGVGGVDAALFVVAADEGVMPQTREHLAILDLLDVRYGVVALTKVDLVPDEEWLALVEEDVHSLMAGTSLSEAPIVHVSASTGEGVDALSATLDAVLATSPRSVDVGRPRLPIDRAFTISGFGTVVTGTLLDGELRVAQPVEIEPGGARGRIRGLQTHKQDVDVAQPGSRVAANVSGLDVSSVSRGDVLIPPGADRPTRRIIVHVRVLESSPSALEHNQQVKVFVGAAQRMGRVRMPYTKSLPPGERGFIELRLDQPVLVRRGDRYILRRPSPPTTLAGGLIADPHPKRRRYRFDQAETERLQSLIGGDDESIVLALVKGMGPATSTDLVKSGNLKLDSVTRALDELEAAGKLVRLPSGDGGETFFVNATAWDDLRDSMLATLAEYHHTHRLRFGMPSEELKTKLSLRERVFALVIDRLRTSGDIQLEQGRARLSSFSVELNSAERKRVDEMMAALDIDPHAPPDPDSLRSMVGAELFGHLIARGDLVPVSEDVVFEKSAFDSMVRLVCGAIESDGPRTVAQLRDLLGTSRKYTLALLEHMDQLGWTVRKGDVRVLSRPPG
ncbi:MAG: selenocysteine-specific translation elongation factor [Anaerolineales bacterium]